MLKFSAYLPRSLGLLCALACACQPPSQNLQNTKIGDDQGEPSFSFKDTRSHRKVLEKIFAPSSDCNNSSIKPSLPLIRRLTRDEYQNSIRDLFAISSDIRELIPADEEVFGFRNNSSLNLVSVDHAVAYSRSAGRIAEQILQKKSLGLFSCSFETEGRNCAEQFIRQNITKIWRKAASEDSIQQLLTIYDIGAEQSPTAGVKLLLRAFLSAPSFLYRSELGKDGQLDAYEWASALAYFFWASTPDDRLLQLAADGSLLREDVLANEIQRLLVDPKAREGIKAFADSWVAYAQVLQVNKDGNKFPEFNTRARMMLAQETEDTFDHMIRERQTDYQTMMLAEYSLGSPELAAYYGVPSTSDAQGRTLLDFQNQGRRGLLGHGSLLASLSYAHETHPIKRGIFIRQQILCEHLLPPPPTLNIKPPPPKEGASTRERFAVHSSAALCKSCHVRIDGLGFGMEDFDPVGRMRTVDNGRPVDASGQIFDVDGETRDFNGGRQLTEMLAHSPRAQRCFALQWYRMAHGRIEEDADVCAIRQLGDRMQGGLSIRDLMVQVITHPSFRQRSP